MRKIILGIVALAAAASFGQASAEPLPAPLNGCNVTGADSPGGTSCTYTATGAAANLVIATPNSVSLKWTIDALVPDGSGGTVCVSTGTGVAYDESEASLMQGPQAAGAIPASDCAGPNVVTLKVGPDSAGFVEGWIGSVTVVETPA